MTLNSLSAGTKYYYRAVIQFGEKDYYGETKSFTTLAAQQSTLGGYLELPAATSGSNLYNEMLGKGTSRNYSYSYDKTMYASVWEAYPLTASHISGSASSNWSFNPNIAQTDQIDVVGNSYGTNYGNSLYSRGHQVPNADRKSSSMNAATYYVTNQTPQIQNKFNGSVWGTLETAIRNLTSSTDTVYVVTGPVYKKVGGSETINYLTAAKTTVKPSKIPVPNYYWKAVLKVKRTNGVVTSAQAVGFWFEHKEYESGTSYTPYAVSVDQIEAWTGLDLFANLPDTIEAAAESNSSWTTLQSF